MNKSYRSDLTDEQWEIMKTLIPPAKNGGRPRTVDMRGVINGIFDILVAGCPKGYRSAYAWCLLPHDFPKWKSRLSLLPTNGALMGTGNESTSN